MEKKISAEGSLTVLIKGKKVTIAKAEYYYEESSPEKHYVTNEQFERNAKLIKAKYKELYGAKKEVVK